MTLRKLLVFSLLICIVGMSDLVTSKVLYPKILERGNSTDLSAPLSIILAYFNFFFYLHRNFVILTSAFRTKLRVVYRYFFKKLSYKWPFPHLDALFHSLQLYLEHKYFRKNLELLKGILPLFA